MTDKPMLPCPFCGSDPFPLEWPEGGDTGEVRCLELGCPIDDVFIPIEQWNRPRMKVPVNSETVAVFEIDHSGYRARVVLDPAKPFPPDGTLLYAEQPAPISVMPDVDELAQIIRKVDGSRNLGAGSLAEAILEEVARLNGLKP